MCARKGRDFEKLVASLEKYAGPRDLIVQSPEYIIGKDSEIKREVDVTLRGKLGSSSILIAIECRDRKDKEGTSWIEELATKRDDICADAMIAVTTSSISKPAIHYANKKGIKLRKVDEFDPNDIDLMFHLPKVNFAQSRFDLIGVFVDIEEKNPEAGILSMKPSDVIIIRDIDSNRTQSSLIELLRYTDLNKHLPSPFSIKFNEEQFIRLAIPNNESYYIKGQKNMYKVKRIVLRVKPVFETKKVPLTKIQTYEDLSSGDTISTTAAFSTKIGVDEYTIRLVQQETTGQQSISVDKK